MASTICCVAILLCGLSISSWTRAAMSSRVLSLCPCPRALCGAHWYPAERYASDALFPSASPCAKSSWRSFRRTGIIDSQHIAFTAFPYHNIGGLAYRGISRSRSSRSTVSGSVALAQAERRLGHAPYVEHHPPNIGAAKVWLYNRQPERWRDKREVEHADSDDVGRAFRFDVGHLFRSKSAGRSD